MTICIAALCEDSQKVVVTSDKMLTAGMLSIQFEHPESKIIEITKTCVIMTAGAGLRQTELVTALKKQISGLVTSTVPDIVEKIKDIYQKARLKKAEELYLKPIGLTLSDFPRQAQFLSPDVSMSLNEQISSYDYGIEIIVAGVDNEGGHIYFIGNPGTSECFDSIGYFQIGSGEPHAAQCFIENSYSQKANLYDALWAVYNGKKRAENAPGVGKAGEFAIIGNDKILYLEDSVLKELEKLRSENESIKDQYFKNEVSPKLTSIKFGTE